MDIKILHKLSEIYDINTRREKWYCPKSIVCIVEQFIDKKWITDVEYYTAWDDKQVVICGKTDIHHDVFYQSPLTEMLWKMGCHVFPNEHCESVLGKGYIVIHLPDKRRLISAEGKAKGVEALICAAFEVFKTR